MYSHPTGTLCTGWRLLLSAYDNSVSLSLVFVLDSPCIVHYLGESLNYRQYCLFELAPFFPMKRFSTFVVLILGERDVLLENQRNDFSFLKKGLKEEKT